MTGPSGPDRTPPRARPGRDGPKWCHVPPPTALRATPARRPVCSPARCGWSGAAPRPLRVLVDALADGVFPRPGRRGLRPYGGPADHGPRPSRSPPRLLGGFEPVTRATGGTRNRGRRLVHPRHPTGRDGRVDRGGRGAPAGHPAPRTVVVAPTRPDVPHPPEPLPPGTGAARLAPPGGVRQPGRDAGQEVETGAEQEQRRVDGDDRDAEGAGESVGAGDPAQRANLTTGAITGVVNRFERADTPDARTPRATAGGCAPCPTPRPSPVSSKRTEATTAAWPASSPTTRLRRSPCSRTPAHPHHRGPGGRRTRHAKPTDGSGGALGGHRDGPFAISPDEEPASRRSSRSRGRPPAERAHHDTVAHA